MDESAHAPKQEVRPPPGVTKLAWPLIALGLILLALALVSYLLARRQRLRLSEPHRSCNIEFTTPGGTAPEDTPPQSARVEPPPPSLDTRETGEAQVQFAPASFYIQDSSQPTTAQTPEAEQKRGKRKGMRRLFDWLRGKSSKEPVEDVGKRRPVPPKLNPSANVVTLCPGKESQARVQVTASGFDDACPPLGYHWRVDAGRIEGRGAVVTWDLRGVQPGKYRAVFRADVNHACYDCRNCDAFGVTQVIVRDCPTSMPTPTPTPTATPTPISSYNCPNLYCYTVTRGSSVTFTAQGSGINAGASSNYRWSVSAGRISAGQGTSSIEVDTAGLKEGTEIYATFAVEAYNRTCTASCKAVVGSFYSPTPTTSPTASPTPTPTPTPEPSPSAGDSRERQIIGVHYQKQLTRGQPATISFKWTRVRAEASEHLEAADSSAPEIIPASFAQTADEQSPGEVAFLHLHSNDLNPQNWSIKLPLRSGEETSLTINPESYAGQQAFTLEVDALEVDGVMWKRANDWFWVDALVKGQCGAHSFVINVFSTSPPYVPLGLLLCGVIVLLAGDYLRRMAQGAALKEAAESVLAESKQPASASAATEGDDVRCTVFAPTEAPQGKSFMVIAFAHLAEQAALLADMAKSMSKSVEQRGPGKKLGAKIERGEELLFSLEMPGLEIDEPNQSLTWEGEPDSVQFGVTVPKDFETGSLIGTVRVAYRSVPVGHVKFEFEIVEAAPRAEKSAAATVAAPPAAPTISFDNYVRYRQVFISYASQDRAEVLKRVQMMSMMKIKFFQDLLTLEPGDDWEKTIYKYLDQSDAVFLFWSSHAKKSAWVEKELQYVLNREGERPDIVPIIIETPAPLPPPDYLKSLHFNDKIMYLIKVEEDARRNTARTGE